MRNTGTQVIHNLFGSLKEQLASIKTQAILNT